MVVEPPEGGAGLGLTVFWSSSCEPSVWLLSGTEAVVVPELMSELDEDEELDSELEDEDEVESDRVGSRADVVEVVLGRPPPWSPPPRHDVLSELSMATF